MDTMGETTSLTKVLGELTFPAEKWEITTCAEIYGADLSTRRRLYDLPVRTYRDRTDIAAALR